MAEKRSVTEEDVEEMLLCARYGEVDEMKELIELGVPVDSKDGMGNTALHYAAANGLMDCAEYLVKKKCPYLPNNSGNLPLHWAIQNKAADVVQLLMKSYPEVNVLQTNEFGKSAVTEAFNAQDQQILKLVLEHPSAAALEEEGKDGSSGKGGSGSGAKKGTAASKKKPQQKGKKQKQDASKKKEDDATATASTAQQDKATSDASDSKSTAGRDDTAESSQVLQTHTHDMRFSPDGPEVHVREIATDWFGKVFGDMPEDDTTGIQLWAASLIAARWVVDVAARLDGARVLELGAGCGLPGLAALAYTHAKQVVITDYFSHTVDNIKHNLSINAHIPTLTERGHVHALDWNNENTWLHESDGNLCQFDVLLGCDLVYDTPLVAPLCNLVRRCLAPHGTFFYVSGGKRKGAKEFITALRDCGLECKIAPLKPEYKANPLVSGDEQELELHFNELHENVQVLFEFSWPSKTVTNNDGDGGEDGRTASDADAGDDDDDDDDEKEDKREDVTKDDSTQDIGKDNGDA
ncbi:hypothetical protein PTSG_03004 [Salpingoeca rosetta]|uniref:Uncharacterized protein n=1 Tax=Salpingoeca rosetta (strain ATCC 50818 / BSB-021) TaxID=946362 RepID=F2U3Z6_SALR5|nr:uncharacterized protein PTSG_03004 [Salpingoeca rosetta]EGD82340.1 hypothetical protein PTSG_03004 [Salpingoeca rosetta]|eukprot:XP_004996523.1 hypothetical protein PTSG_03004 [Salpingoeca rosetta]